jgi:hypothetical protein
MNKKETLFTLKVKETTLEFIVNLGSVGWIREVEGREIKALIPLYSLRI